MIDPMSVPLAYIITFRCYATWLHGDDRGSMNRPDAHAAPVRPYNPALENWERTNSGPRAYLNAPRRRAVREAIREACAYRTWQLHAINVRTEHVHVVITAPVPPERVMTILKARCTRMLRVAGLAEATERIWSRHGSTDPLWKESDVTAACEYTMENQGGDI
ncbi:hypothetical protein AYO38_05780 [bacterium SCGC AG-212-C10]|nr:hypothetical protein AYO38_05780 [bacterium SCGC AG-212-C10]